MKFQKFNRISQSYVPQVQVPNIQTEGIKRKNKDEFKYNEGCPFPAYKPKTKK